LRSVTERAPWLLAAAYLAAALHGLGAADVVGDDEAREVGIVQDVVAGAWLWPRFNGELLPDKPLLYHWLAAAPVALSGFSEAAVRLPSAVAAAALVGGTARAGTALFGAPAGVVAGALLATTPTLMSRARVARPDVLLVLLLSAALGLAFRWWRDGRRRDATLALALVGAATLAKGPVAPVLFAAALGGFLLWQRELRRLPSLLTLPGVAVAAVLGLGWYALALAGWGELFVREHLVGRYLGNLIGGLGGGRPYSSRPLAFHLLYYPTHLPLVALPWSPIAALAVWQAWRADRLRDPRLRFLLCAALAPVVVFTPAQYKLRYYLLPALPALALLAAPAVVALAARPAARPRARALGLAALAAGALALLAWAALADRLPLSRSDRVTLAAVVPHLPGGAGGGALGVGLAAGVLLAAAASRAWAAALLLVAAGGAVGTVVVVPRAAEAVAARDSLATFARGAAETFPPPTPLVFYRETIRPVVVYAGRRVPTIVRPERLPAGAGVIATEDGYAELARAGAVGPPLDAAEGRVGNVDRGLAVLAEAIPRGVEAGRRTTTRPAVPLCRRRTPATFPRCPAPSPRSIASSAPGCASRSASST
jgi:4-amino-4-deoxy-L-arabinose transferase-like glycosyltransferase